MPSTTSSPTLLPVPRTLSRETRELLPSPDTTLAEVSAAIDRFADARRREKTAEKIADDAQKLFMPVVREVFARTWVERGARPKSPLAVVSQIGTEVGVAIEERRGQAIDEATADKLADAVGPDLFTALVVRGRAYRFSDELLADSSIRRKLKAAIEASDFTPEEKAAIVQEVPAYSFRTSIEGGLSELAKRGWPLLTQALTALSAVVRQYPKLPTAKK